MRFDGKPTVQMWCVHRGLLGGNPKIKLRGTKMKQLMNCMASCMVLLLLSGCMDTASRFWNNGLPISERKSKDYRECYSEVRAQDPVMAKSNLTQSELEKFYDRVGSCMQSKGYE